MPHTPGPWTIEHNSVGAPVIKTQAGYIACAERKNQEMDARLISAAPDLLAALRLVLALHEHRDQMGPGGAVPGYRVHLDPMAERQVREAIAKAEGRDNG